MYEEYKDDPVVPRDAPPAGGAIYWSRQLMSHIEEPMKVAQIYFNPQRCSNQTLTDISREQDVESKQRVPQNSEVL